MEFFKQLVKKVKKNKINYTYTPEALFLQQEKKLTGI